MSSIFTPDIETNRKKILFPIEKVENYSAVIQADPRLNLETKALKFAEQIAQNVYSDFENENTDKMCHVSTFICKNSNVYVSYYASTSSCEENPSFQTARLVYCALKNPYSKKFLDIQNAGDTICGRKVIGVYDTVIMCRDDQPENIYILWTANLEGKYYRLYRIFNIYDETLSEIGVNRFKVGGTTNDFSSSGMQKALTTEGIGFKEFFSDIGIMQKISNRTENGTVYYYTGAYSGNFTCIVKSKDLITWEYVAQPDIGRNETGFRNQTKWENAVYQLNGKIYYFVRQWDPVFDENGTIIKGSRYGVLTYYDLYTQEWEKPVLVADCQSRSDFIVYKNRLFLFHAPSDRNHIGIIEVNQNNLPQSKVILQSDIGSSCFYPFVQYFESNELAMSYTVDRKHIRLSKFNLDNFI